MGQTVAASKNAPTLFVIANDLSQMQINASVSEADVGTVEEGQKATFTVDAYPNRTFTGDVTQIRNSPITVQNVVTYDTIIAVSNQDLKLKPGMTATVSIISAERKGVVKIPNAALRFRPPEPSTNLAFTARMLQKLGLAKKAPAQANAPAAKSGTNQVAAQSSRPSLTGSEAREELLRRMRELRERGEEPPPELRGRIRYPRTVLNDAELKLAFERYCKKAGTAPPKKIVVPSNGMDYSAVLDSITTVLMRLEGKVDALHAAWTTPATPKVWDEDQKSEHGH